MKREPFSECVEWADAVIGPLASGALLETLASGTPYYPILLNPHTLEPSFYGDFEVYETTTEACDALLAQTPIDGRQLLDALYNTDWKPRTICL